MCWNPKLMTGCNLPMYVCVRLDSVWCFHYYDRIELLNMRLSKRRGSFSLLGWCFFGERLWGFKRFSRWGQVTGKKRSWEVETVNETLSCQVQWRLSCIMICNDCSGPSRWPIQQPGIARGAWSFGRKTSVCVTVRVKLVPSFPRSNYYGHSHRSGPHNYQVNCTNSQSSRLWLSSESDLKVAWTVILMHKYFFNILM